MYGEITLIEAVNSTETEKTGVFAEVYSITQSEFATAGQKDIKPAYKFSVWQFEYDGQTEILYNGMRLTVYRTFLRDDDKIELYAR